MAHARWWHCDIRRLSTTAPRPPAKSLTALPASAAPPAPRCKRAKWCRRGWQGSRRKCERARSHSLANLGRRSGETAGSTLVTMIETVLSLLRRMSSVRNCCGRSRSEQVSTSQNPRVGSPAVRLRGHDVDVAMSRHPQDEIGIGVQHVQHVGSAIRPGHMGNGVVSVRLFCGTIGTCAAIIMSCWPPGPPAVRRPAN